MILKTKCVIFDKESNLAQYPSPDRSGILFIFSLKIKR